MYNGMYNEYAEYVIT